MSRASTQNEKRVRISLDSFNIYSKVILRVLDVLPGFIIGTLKLNVRYVDVVVVMADTERKLEENLDKLLKESVKKRITIKEKKIKCTVVSKRDSPSYELAPSESRKYGNLSGYHNRR